MIKNIFRKSIRNLLRVKKNETVRSAINRYAVKIQRVFYKEKFDSLELKKALLALGITAGDNLMIHASWRQFYNYSGNPDNVIDILQELIGSEGTLFMPSYGFDKAYFDVENTPSNAGVISEIFRKRPDVFRSASTHFSVAAQGPLAEKITKDHIFSEYGFDCFSPYYKFSSLNNSKILFMGLGRKPTKISLFHCAAYDLMDNDAYLKDLLSYRYTAKLVKNGKVYEKEMIMRKPGHPNNNKVFKKIYTSINNKDSNKISNLKLVVIDASEGLKRAMEYTENGIYCYK